MTTSGELCKNGPMTAHLPVPEATDLYWTVELRTSAPSLLNYGAREYSAQLLLQHEDLGRYRSAGDAHLVMVPFGKSATTFLDCADEVSEQTRAAAQYVASTLKILHSPGMIFVSSVEIKEDVRGYQLGLFLLTNAVRAITALAPDALVVIEPAPPRAESLLPPVRRKAISKLASYLDSVGFEFSAFEQQPKFMYVPARALKDVARYPRVPFDITPRES